MAASQHGGEMEEEVDGKQVCSRETKHMVSLLYNNSFSLQLIQVL
jgi:hypothetical protein